MKRLVTVLILAALAAVFWLGRCPLAAKLYAWGLEAETQWRLADARHLLGLAAQFGHQEARLELVRTLEKSGNIPAARRLLDELLATAREDPRLDTRILATDARILYLSGDQDAALERFNQALEAAQRLEDDLLQGQLLLASSSLYSKYFGDLEEAQKRLENALEIARASGFEDLEADVLSGLGVFYWSYLRQRERPLPEFYTPALEIYERLNNRHGIAATRARIGLVYLAQARYQDCARELEASRAGYEMLGDRRGLGDVYRYLGAMYAGLENYPQAHEHYRKSLEIATASGDADAQRRLAPLLVDLELRRGEFAHAAELFESLIAVAPDPSTELRTLLTRRGHVLLHLGRTPEALASYQRALDVHQATAGSDEPNHSQILTGLSHAHRQAGDLEAAARLLAQAERIPLESKGWGETIHTLLARADLADAQGEPEAALRTLLEAAEIESRTYGTAASHFYQSQYRQVLDRLFSLLLTEVTIKEQAEELVFRLLEQMRYRSFRSLLVRQAPSPNQARTPGAEELAAVHRIEAASRRLAGSFREDSWQELRQAYADYEDHLLRRELADGSYRLADAARPVELSALRERMPEAVALVEYVLAGEQVFALVVSRHGVECIVLPVETSELEPKAKLFRHRIFKSSAADWQSLATELGRLLVEPLEQSPALDGVRRLTVVPMGFLHDLPFAALSDSSSRLLVERYTLSLAPSATLWSKANAFETAEQGATIAFGLRQASTSQLEPLDFAEQEAAAVVQALGGQVRLGAEATEATFKALAPSARRIHMATHSILEKRLPLHSRLRLEPGGGEDGNLTVREILDLELHAELVTLSACETAWSHSTDLEVDRLGFVEAFLHAGARNVVASLLPVSDGASATFMAAFYKQLKTMPPAEALAATQRQMAAAEGSRPRHWASFVLVGRQ